MNTAVVLHGHDQRLQSLRGIAAMTVLLGHCHVTFSNIRIEYAKVSGDTALSAFLQLNLHANSAVIFFYVLSGLVLGESVRRRSSSAGWLDFVIRRIFRLYPVMIVSVLAAAIVALLNSEIQVPGMIPAMLDAMKPNVDFGIVIRDALSVDYKLNPLLWSVQVEIAMIAVLPFLIVISDRTNIYVDIALFLVLVYASVEHWSPTPNALRYVYCFQLGVILPRLIRSSIAKHFFESYWAAVAGLMLMTATEWLYITGKLWMPYKFVTDTIICAQWIGFVIARPEIRAIKALTARPLVFLGDISYSLYCYSMVIQFALTGFVLSKVVSVPPSPIEATAIVLFLMAANTIIVIPIAWLSFRYIEKPMIELGRQLIERRRQAEIFS